MLQTIHTIYCNLSRKYDLNMTAKLETIKRTFEEIQDEICEGLANIDGKATFEEDQWIRRGGGGGKSRVIADGAVFEKGGVNFSHVFGIMPDVITHKLGLPEGVQFDATGVSIVIHPESPKIPIIHANIRYFEVEDGRYWFGGGIDLTPIYVVPEDAISFHQVLKDTCDQFDPGYYLKFKQWCDEYFYIKHRKETRGIGGIFFDHMKATNQKDKDRLFDFVVAVGKSFLPSYLPIVSKYKDVAYNDAEKDFQLFRRSRYVEFNLVYDKGTKFGLDTDGRTESILMSMPPMAAWPYKYEPLPGSEEAQTLSLLHPRDWINETVLV